ncbi:MAG: trehalose-phosphatase [Mycobacteriales bacterium]|nr:trehalose-phosphatase [Frankia sp.]
MSERTARDPRARTVAGDAVLRAIRDAPADALIAIDYDGTLAPIVARPEDARPARGAVEALLSLAPRVRCLAVVTGRPAAQLVELAGLAAGEPLRGLTVIGHYGMERWEGATGALTSAPPSRGVREAHDILRRLAELAPTGVVVEDKGASVAIHTRQADEPDVALAALRPAVAELAVETGLEVAPGRLVLELRPGGTDKGVALRALAAECSPRAVLYVGDDIGDAAAFDVVDELCRGGLDAATVFADSSEGPAMLRDRADVVVAGPEGVVALLRELAGDDDAVRAAQRQSQQQYGAVAERYATSESHARGDDLEWFTSRAGDVLPGVALDVACGGGFSTRALLGGGHRVVASDLTFASVAAARSATDGGAVAIWVAGAAERLPVQTESVSLVGCRIAPHHFGDVARFVDEVARVLVPGGVFLLVDTTVPEDEALAQWINDLERVRDPSHQRAWPATRWAAVVTGAGLRITESRAFRKQHPLEPWLARAGCDDTQRAEVHARLRAATPEAIDAYDLVFDDAGEPVSFTDTKLCIQAVKPVPIAPRSGESSPIPLADDPDLRR